MRPAIIAFALALFLFLLVQGIRPPLLYAALLVPVVILVYGIVAEDLPEAKFDDEEEDGETEGEDDGKESSGTAGLSRK